MSEAPIIDTINIKQRQNLFKWSEIIKNVKLSQQHSAVVWKKSRKRVFEKVEKEFHEEVNICNIDDMNISEQLKTIIFEQRTID